MSESNFTGSIKVENRVNFSASANYFYNKYSILFNSFNLYSSSKGISYKQPELTNNTIKELALFEEYLVLKNKNKNLNSFAELFGLLRSNTSVEESLFLKFYNNTKEQTEIDKRKLVNDKEKYNKTIVVVRKNKTKEEIEEEIRLKKFSIFEIKELMKVCCATELNNNIEYLYLMAKGYTSLKDYILHIKKKKNIETRLLLDYVNILELNKPKEINVYTLLNLLEKYFYNKSIEYIAKAKEMTYKITYLANRITEEGKQLYTENPIEFTIEDFKSIYNVPDILIPVLKYKPVQLLTITEEVREGYIVNTVKKLNN